MRALIIAILTALGLFSAVSATAQQRFENLDRIDSIVAMTVGANIGQPGGALAPVDRRLRLAPCPQVPEVSGPLFGAAVVECKPIGWRIRVPLSAQPAAVAQPVNTAWQPRAATPRAAQPAAPVVKKGDPVQLIAGGDSFTVSKLMIAEEDGAAGQMIRVREDKKGSPVLAQVVEMGVVRIPGFKDF